MSFHVFVVHLCLRRNVYLSPWLFSNWSFVFFVVVGVVSSLYIIDTVPLSGI